MPSEDFKDSEYYKDLKREYESNMFGAEGELTFDEFLSAVVSEAEYSPGEEGKLFSQEFISFVTEEMDEQAVLDANQSTPNMMVFRGCMNNIIEAQKIKRAKKNSECERNIREILSTEESYLKTLDNLLEIKKHPDFEKKFPVKSNLNQLIQQVEKLQSLSKVIKGKLEEINIDLTLENLKDKVKEISAVFLEEEIVEGLKKGFSNYIVLYGKVVEEVKKFDDEKLEIIGNKTFSNFAITPIQRIPRYELLFREVIRNSGLGEEEVAIDAMLKIKKIAAYINENKRKVEIRSALNRGAVKFDVDFNINSKESFNQYMQGMNGVKKELKIKSNGDYYQYTHGKNQKLFRFYFNEVTKKIEVKLYTNGKKEKEFLEFLRGFLDSDAAKKDDFIILVSGNLERQFAQLFKEHEEQKLSRPESPELSRASSVSSLSSMSSNSTNSSIASTLSTESVKYMAKHKVKISSEEIQNSLKILEVAKFVGLSMAFSGELGSKFEVRKSKSGKNIHLQTKGGVEVCKINFAKDGGRIEFNFQRVSEEEGERNFQRSVNLMQELINSIEPDSIDPSQKNLRRIFLETIQQVSIQYGLFPTNAQEPRLDSLEKPAGPPPAARGRPPPSRNPGITSDMSAPMPEDSINVPGPTCNDSDEHSFYITSRNEIEKREKILRSPGIDKEIKEGLKVEIISIYKKQLEFMRDRYLKLPINSIHNLRSFCYNQILS